MARVAQAMRMTWHRNQIAAPAQPADLRRTPRTKLSHSLPISSLDQVGAQATELLVGDRSRLLEPVELLDLVGDAEADRLAQLLAGLLRLLAAALRHAFRLADHVREDRNIGKHDQRYHPDRLAPAVYVMTAEQVADDDDEQPEP